MATLDSNALMAEIDEAMARHSHQFDGLIDTVLDQHVSDYPILVWQHEAHLELGVLVKEDVQPGNWTVRLTTLEEMVSKNLLLPDRVQDFRKVFNNARQQYGLFVVRPEGANFVFRPRA